MIVSELVRVWYERNKRNLPWREEGIAYQVWISEIILQQTRVNQGTPYYNSFIQRFPDIKTLADSQVEDVLLQWQGLGYYSRARNLHKAARIIMEDHGGRFPEDYKAIRDLPGIGDYTAAAIASLAFNQPYAAVDGNVYRVLARFLAIGEPINSGVGKKVFQAAANDLLDKKNPGRHNQAMIELGALVCLPQNPGCAECPLQESCRAFKTSSVLELPVKLKKRKPIHRYFTYLVIRQGESLHLHQRDEKDIWALLFDFPLIETTQALIREDIFVQKTWKELIADTPVVIKRNHKGYRHVLSHQILHVQFILVEIEKPVRNEGLISVPISEISNYPLPGLISKFLEEEKLFRNSK